MDLTAKWTFLRDQALPAMAEATFPYIASVFGVADEQHGQHEGSGLRCILGGRRCLVTALHVLEGARSYPGGIAVSTGYGRRPCLVHGQVVFERDADLAVLPLPADYPDDPSAVKFWPEERIERSSDRRATDYLFVHGFPCAESVPASDGIANRSFPYGAMEMLPDEGLPTTLAAHQFGIHFGSTGIPRPAPEWLSNPRGLSGCPVWRLGLSGRTAKGWLPEHSVLVGIVTEHWRSPELNGKDFLLATAASTIIAIKERTIGERAGSSVRFSSTR